MGMTQKGRKSLDFIGSVLSEITFVCLDLMPLLSIICAKAGRLSQPSIGGVAEVRLLPESVWADTWPG